MTRAATSGRPGIAAMVRDNLIIVSLPWTRRARKLKKLFRRDSCFLVHELFGAGLVCLGRQRDDETTNQPGREVGARA